MEKKKIFIVPMWVTMMMTVLFNYCEGSTAYCTDPGVVPDHGTRSPPVSFDERYFESSVLRYFCDAGYTISSGFSTQICTNVGGYLSWEPLQPPTCIQNAQKPCSPLQDPPYGRTFCVNTNDNADQCSNQSMWPSGTVAVVSCSGYSENLALPNRTCSNGVWNGEEFSCVCPRLQPITSGSFYPIQTDYPIGTNITYYCRSGMYPTAGSLVRTCLASLQWSGTPPTCAAATGHPPMYCPKPADINHGAVLCCSLPPGSDATDVCCPSGGKVQFVCESSYKLIGQPELICTSDGQWSGKGWQQEVRHPAPTCVQDVTSTAPSHLGDNEMPNDMMRAVIGVAVGVLSLLLLVIALAFCKPRLQDIKRRWRDMREDENGLIVNGQRVNLPSYEEATSCVEQSPCNPFGEIGAAPRLNSFARDAVSRSPSRYGEFVPSHSASHDVTASPSLSDQARVAPSLAMEGSVDLLAQTTSAHVPVDVHSDVTQETRRHDSVETEYSSFGFEDDFVTSSPVTHDTPSERSASPNSLCALLTPTVTLESPSCSSGETRPPFDHVTTERVDAETCSVALTAAFGEDGSLVCDPQIDDRSSVNAQIDDRSSVNAFDQFLVIASTSTAGDSPVVLVDHCTSDSTTV